MRRLLALALSASAACAPAGPPLRDGTASELRAQAGGVAASRPRADASPAEPTGPAPGSRAPLASLLPSSAGTPDAPDVEDAPLRERRLPPAGVACAIYGTGSGAQMPCGSPPVEVVSRRGGTAPVAVVELSGLDLSWGFFAEGGRAWFSANDGIFAVDGFASPDNARFVLRREAPIVEEHVWLKAGLLVRAKSASARGVAVAFDTDIEGLDDIPARVPCEALLYDAPDDDAAPITLPASVDEPLYAGVAPVTFLSGPGGAPVARLGSALTPLELQLEEVERRGGFTRVRFETDQARFDVWAADMHLAEEPLMPSIGGSQCCGGGLGLSGGSNVTFIAREATPVIVGASPRAPLGAGVSLVKGGRVLVLSERDGFSEISSSGRSSIVAPSKSSFWVPSEALERR